MKLEAANTWPYDEIAQSVQHTFGPAGVKVEIVPGEWKTLVANYRAKKHQAVLMGWVPDFLDPHKDADFFASNTPISLATRNAWTIPELSKETAAAAREPDPAKRVALYEELQRRVTDEGPYILMFLSNKQVARRAEVTGFRLGLADDLTAYRFTAKP